MAKGIDVKKDKNFSEWFDQIVQKAELADIRYNVQGFIVHLPYGLKIANKIYSLFEDALDESGHEQFLLPTVIPEDNLKREEEHAGFVPDVFWVETAGEKRLERRLALRPTGETQIYPMYSIWIRSHRQLPFKRYQSRITTFRNEMTTRPFLRGREFMFFESHDCFADHKGALEQIRKDMEVMKEIVQERLYIPFIFFKRPYWDKFKGADDTYASDTLNPDGRRNQISSTHDLGHNFAKAFDIKFTNDDGKEEYVWQTCFGPGIWRIIAALISIHGDDKGLILPSTVSPYQVVVIPITFKGKENKKIFERCKEVVSILKKEYRVKYDDRSSKSPGEKYNEWELKGVPVRIEIGPKEAENNSLVIARRGDKKKENVDFDKHTLLKEIKEEIRNVDEWVKARAEGYFNNKSKEADNLDDAKKIIDKSRGFVKVPFCSVGKEGEKCADKLKVETGGAYVCGTKLDDKTDNEGRCIICGKKSDILVYIAKSI